MEIQTITTHDNHQYEIRIGECETPAAPVAIIFPAMAVKARFYEPLAAALNQAGMHAVIHELRGVGSSNKRPKKGDDFGYVDLVETDWSATIAAAKQRFPNAKRLLIGNSLGGQLSALHLSSHPDAADALALIASCSVYYKHYPNRKMSTLVGTQAMSLIGKTLGYAPGKQLGFAGDEAKTLIGDWARQARTGNYLPKNSTVNYEQLMGQLNKPVIAHPIAGDKLAPTPAVEHLVGKLSKCKVELRVLNASDINSEKLTHFSWGKHPGTLAQQLSDWFATAASAA